MTTGRLEWLELSPPPRRKNFPRKPARQPATSAAPHSMPTPPLYQRRQQAKRLGVTDGFDRLICLDDSEKILCWEQQGWWGGTKEHTAQ